MANVDDVGGFPAVQRVPLVGPLGVPANEHLHFALADGERFRDLPGTPVALFEFEAGAFVFCNEPISQLPLYIVYKF